MKKIFIAHFAPLELYPPIQNLIRELNSSRVSVRVCTTKQWRGKLAQIRSSPNIQIDRFSSSGAAMPAVFRYVGYVVFYSRTLLRLILDKPDKVLYFETLSAWPVYMYYRYVRKVPVFIHYHEYATPQEIQGGMVLGRIFHRLEKYLYPEATWLSHTHIMRLDRFLEDIRPIKLRRAMVMPNFPPKQWLRNPKNNVRLPLKFVYVGALNMQSMYVREFAHWIASHGTAEVSWTIYGSNCTTETKSFLEHLNSDTIRICDGVDYDKLPSLLEQFNVGVVLYKGHISNYVINAPNKLFEYLACGLSVILPSVMTGSLVYAKSDEYPTVTALDFQKLDNISPGQLLHQPGLAKARDSYVSESALSPLMRELVGE